MLVTKTAEYAIRAVTILATNQSADCMSSAALSKLGSIPPSYLSKILQQLVAAELLSTQKGPNGGYRIDKPLKKIKILHVLEAVDICLDITHCPFGFDNCGGAEPCPVHASYQHVKKTYYKWAATTTLADLASASQKP